MKYGLSEAQLQETIAFIGQYPEVEAAVLFGSRAIDTYKEASDVDIALKGARVTHGLAAKMKFDIEEDSVLPFFFDFVAYPLITNEALKTHIDTKGAVIFRRGGAGEWKVCKLGQITSKIGSGATPTGGESAYKSEGISLIRSQNVLDFGFSDGGLAFIDDAQADELRNVEVIKNDILINITGESVTRCCIAPKKYLPARVNQHVLIIRPISEQADFHFVYYYFHSIKPKLHSMAEIGGTRRALTKGMFEQLDILLPPLPEQRAIAGVLSSLDDKLDLLHRQNKTLEAMAEALFRQWFIEEADAGWKTVKVGDFVKTNIASIDKSSNIKTIRYLDTGSLVQGMILEYQPFEISEAPSRARRIVKHNDILISTVRPDQKHYGIIKNPDKDIIVSTGFCVITCERINPHFIYTALTMDEMTEFLHSIADGSTSTYPSLKPSDIENIEFQLPPESKLRAFSDYADKAWEKIDRNHNQIRTLERLRDTLLPKLMSGEVRVSVLT